MPAFSPRSRAPLSRAALCFTATHPRSRGVCGFARYGEQLGKALCDASKHLPSLHALRLTLCDDPPSRASASPPSANPPSAGGGGPAAPSAPAAANKKGGRSRPLNALGFLKQFGRGSFPKVVDLALVGARLGRDSVLELSGQLGDERCSLTSLDLGHALIGPEGVAAIAAALRKRGLAEQRGVHLGAKAAMLAAGEGMGAGDGIAGERLQRE